MAIYQLCAIPMEENLVTSNHNNCTSIFVHSTTVHENSIKTQYNILANTLTLAGGYAIINTVDYSPLPFLTFDNSPTHHEPFISNEPIISNIDFIHSIQHLPTSITQKHHSITTSHSSQTSTYSSLYLD